MGLSDSQNSIKGWVKTGSTERNFLLDRARKNFATGPRLAGAPVQGHRTGHGTAPGYGKAAGRIERDLTQIGERPLSPRLESPMLQMSGDPRLVNHNRRHRSVAASEASGIAARSPRRCPATLGLRTGCVASHPQSRHAYERSALLYRRIARPYPACRAQSGHRYLRPLDPAGVVI